MLNERRRRGVTPGLAVIFGVTVLTLLAGTAAYLRWAWTGQAAQNRAQSPDLLATRPENPETGKASSGSLSE
jgi:hypothetical protein